MGLIKSKLTVPSLVGGLQAGNFGSTFLSICKIVINLIFYFQNYLSFILQYNYFTHRVFVFSISLSSFLLGITLNFFHSAREFLVPQIIQQSLSILDEPSHPQSILFIYHFISKQHATSRAHFTGFCHCN